MKLVILGSGTSTGVPMVGCRCPVCSSSDPHDKRSRTSLLVETKGKNIIVDTSTDLRQQALREGIEHIDAVLFTHSHSDHVNGIDDLRGFHFIHRNIVPCYGDDATMAAIVGRFPYIFKGLEVEGYAPLMEAHSITGRFDLFGCSITPVPLQHGYLMSTGYRFNNSAYLTDCSAIPDSSFPLLDGLELLIIDALRYSPHENHFHIDAALKAVARIRPKRTVLTHLTHEVSHNDSFRLPPGSEFAYDGMTFEL
ncbi:octanoyltransferase [Geobacter sp. OR-1]|uniref:GPMC system MBL fold metallohydrolase n=1 Tax=Geobacter sp. OR-1 TaxID=1266765 RepID=UPI000541B82B|nr:GPMC system MBL fold metallohydrolase [Geobacter sp. OR-1]GAM11172.1 octanoyltransferase [Geobacter sp. OR-1]